MSDIDLFRGLAKRVPLEPITDAETYFAACSLQEELMGSPERAAQLFLKALEMFMDAYDKGYRG